MTYLLATALVNLPSASQLYTDMATTSSPTWDNLYPIAIYGIGIAMGASLIGFLMYVLIGAVSQLWQR